MQMNNEIGIMMAKSMELSWQWVGEGFDVHDLGYRHRQDGCSKLPETVPRLRVSLAHG